MNWLCRMGLHSWLYERMNHPWMSLPVCQMWRGCRKCHKDQYQYYNCGTAVSILDTEWREC